MSSTPQPKDTVRARKKSTANATQRFLPVAEIRNNTILLKNGGMRAVLVVEALNFNLKSETEQQAIISGYGSFVNTLTFPLQIVIRSTRTNIDDYLTQLQSIADKHDNPLLKQQTLGYMQFLEKLIEVADIMQKKFYVVVPLDRSVRHKTSLEQFFDWLHPDDSSAKATQRGKEFNQGSKQLSERIELVNSGLNNIGLHARRLNTRELIDLLYQIYNPKTSQTQKIPTSSEDLHIDNTML